MRRWRWAVMVAVVLSACAEPGRAELDARAPAFRDQRILPPEDPVPEEEGDAGSDDGAGGPDSTEEGDGGSTVEGVWEDHIARDTAAELRTYVAECDRELGTMPGWPSPTPTQAGSWLLLSDAEVSARIDDVLLAPAGAPDPGPVERFGFTEPPACIQRTWPEAPLVSAAKPAAAAPVAAPSTSGLRIERHRYTEAIDGVRYDHDVATCLSPADLVVGWLKHTVETYTPDLREAFTTAWRLRLGEDGRPAHYDIVHDGGFWEPRDFVFEYDSRGRMLNAPDPRSTETIRRAYDDARGLRLEATFSWTSWTTQSSEVVTDDAGRIRVLRRSHGESMGETRDTQWWDYDPSGRLVGGRRLYELLRGGMGPGAWTTTFAYGHDPEGRPVLRWEYERGSDGRAERRALRFTLDCVSGSVLERDVIVEPLPPVGLPTP